MFQKILDYLKIDIEGSENALFETMFKADILSRVKQLSVELHPALELKGESLRHSYFRIWKVIRTLEQLGFQQWMIEHNDNPMSPVALHPNMRGGYCCSNAYYVNINFLNEEER